MNRKLLFLIKNSIKKKTSSKWFKIINIFLLILIAGIINIDSVISFFGGDFTDKMELVVLDNTKQVSQNFTENIKSAKKTLDLDFKLDIKTTTKKRNQLEKKLNDKILIIFTSTENDYLKAKIISNKKIDTTKYQLITTALSTTKYNYGLVKSNINPVEMQKLISPIKIDRIILSNDSTEDNMEIIITTIFPIIILPFFMLVVFLVQMIGAEIYEEKSTRSMEVIISNVSPKVHFLSKIISSNIFAIAQGLLLLAYSFIGLSIRYITNLGKGKLITHQIANLFNAINLSDFIGNLGYIIPLIIILFIFSLLAYSIIAGILASLTVNMEDYQQIQTPIMLILVIAYYLAIMSSMFNGSIFIRILSYIPFISCLLSPALLILGQINVIDLIISIVLLIGFDIIVMKQGLKVYKLGILNYSNEKVWAKFKKIIFKKNG